MKIYGTIVQRLGCLLVAQKMRFRLPLVPPFKENMQSIYLPIPSFEDYLINLDGFVFSTKSNKILSSMVNDTGYTCIRLHKEGKQYNFGIHRLLACAFKKLPNLSSDLEVDHINTDLLYWGLNNLQVLSKQDHALKTLKDKEYSKNNPVFCRDCGIQISLKATKCADCSSHKVKDSTLTLEVIENNVKQFGWSGAGRILNYSDNGLRKRYRALGGNPKELKKI